MKVSLHNAASTLEMTMRRRVHRPALFFLLLTPPFPSLLLLFPLFLLLFSPPLPPPSFSSSSSSRSALRRRGLSPGIKPALPASSVLLLAPPAAPSSCPGAQRIIFIMGFGDLRSSSGLKVLNDFLSDRSYIEGYVPSQADVAVFDAISAAPSADLCHALRWYNHMKSYQSQKNSLPGVKKPLGQYGPAGVADTTSGSGPASKDDDDDDIDLFGSDDEEDAEAARLKEERLAEYAAKKAKKPTLIAKSSILLDVKPWDDETDMAKLEECVRSVQMDGLVWGQSKLVPVGYGIKKLQIGCVVEDDKVGTDILEEKITAFEDFVQSMDVAAFNKI